MYSLFNIYIFLLSGLGQCQTLSLTNNCFHMGTLSNAFCASADPKIAEQWKEFKGVPGPNSRCIYFK